MKKLSTIIIMSLLFEASAFSAKVMRLHAIAFCGTNLEYIGTSCQNDQDRFFNELSFIATAIGCDEEWIVCNGDSFNKSNLEKTLDELECAPNDVVFFYYSGNGIQARNAPSSTWLPQMCFNSEANDEKDIVPVSYVKEVLQSKGARLNIIITDCSNHEAEWVSAKEEKLSVVYNEAIAHKKRPIPILSASDNTNAGAPNIKNLIKLFKKSKGFVVATASKRGQASYTAREGGYFSKAFWDEIYSVENGKSTAKWESILEATRLKTLEYTDGKQEPIYQITKK